VWSAALDPVAAGRARAALLSLAPRRPARTSPTRGQTMNLRLLAVTPSDLPLIERWLGADHVRRFWGDPGANFALLRAPAAPGHWRALIAADGRKVGLVLWQQPTRAQLDQAGLFDLSERAIDIDIMIGERDALGRGIGSATIDVVARAALADPAVPLVMAAAHVDNPASQRAFAKAGFRRDREFDDRPYGRHLLMLRARESPAGG